MFGLSKIEKNLKEAKNFIQNQSLSLANRKVTRDEGKALLAIGYFEIDKIFTGSHKQPSNDELKKYDNEFNYFDQYFKEGRKEISQIKSSQQSISEDYLSNISALVYAEKFFQEDVSDLVISNLTQHLITEYFPNSQLLYNKFHGTFDTCVVFSLRTLGLYLSVFDEWVSVDRKGYEIEGDIKFYKIFRLLREHLMLAKMQDYKESRVLLSG